MAKKTLISLITLSLFLAGYVYATVAEGWKKNIIAAQTSPIYLYVIDMDADGDLDVVSTTNEHPGPFVSEVAWFKNNLNEGSPWETFIIGSSSAEDDPISDINGVAVADIDNDDHYDVVVGRGRVGSANLGGDVYWFKGPDNTSGEWQRFLVSSDADNSYYKMYTMDVDKDGNEDIIAGGSQGSIIFLNPGSPDDEAAVWEKTPLPEGTGSALYLDDVNGDGNTDIINSFLHGNVSWIEIVLDGEEISFNRTIIDDDLDKAFDVNCMDVNGDSKKDVLVSTINAPGLYWYEAPSQDGGAWTKHFISETFSGTDIYTGDVNGDGKKDAVASGAFSDMLSWFEFNTFSQTWTEHSIDNDTQDPGDVSLDDIDGDGDLDAVVAGLMEDQMIWYENRLCSLTGIEPTSVKTGLGIIPRFNKITITGNDSADFSGVVPDDVDFGADRGITVLSATGNGNSVTAVVMFFLAEKGVYNVSVAGCGGAEFTVE
jgi:hypothetical protein